MPSDRGGGLGCAARLLPGFLLRPLAQGGSFQTSHPPIHSNRHLGEPGLRGQGTRDHDKWNQRAEVPRSSRTSRLGSYATRRPRRLGLCPKISQFLARQMASSKLFDDTWAGVAAEGAVQAKNAA
ncbi:hypothetical protein F5144DRAFT_612745 [Chaetomium tenue]|uniref:Uncharacterized protein n=1 Tax=Chaetomium tenue TaxID=1854479 RepID=A0ACB7PBQ7_9PEZI|nr:hypothetical protein F5144DRAFT_612745 [Chaetomium globosum]